MCDDTTCFTNSVHGLVKYRIWCFIWIRDDDGLLGSERQTGYSEERKEEGQDIETHNVGNLAIT